MTKYYELYNFLSNNLGEDVSMKILRMTGVIRVIFYRHHYNIRDSYYINRNKILNVFNKINNYNKDIIQQKSFRNYIFRYNIKVYYLHEIIIDKGTNNYYIPVGRFFEQRPVFPFKKCKILLCDIQYYNNNIYIIIDYVDEIPKNGKDIISKLRCV